MGNLNTTSTHMTDIVMSIKAHQDFNYGIHLRKGPTTEESENSPLFSAETYVLAIQRGVIMAARWADSALQKFYREGEYRTHSTTMGVCSHDNITGIACLREALGLEHHLRDYFNRRILHPRDWCFYLWIKFRWCVPLLSLPCALMILSCWQNWKYRGGNKILKTDGKLLALLRCRAFNLKLTEKICTWLIKRNKLFGSWENVAKIYFKSEEHPVVMLLKEW